MFYATLDTGGCCIARNAAILAFEAAPARKTI